MQRPYDVPSPGPRRHRAWYLTTRARFLVAFMAATAWMGFSVWISLPWIHDLAQVISLVPAVAVIALIAFLPGHLIAFLAAGVLLDRQPRFTITHPTTALTVLIAARNEAPVIGETLDYLATQDYGGPLHVLLIDNGSGDGTADVARQAAARTGLALSVVYEPRQGKSHALNHGLAAAQTSLLVTVDADTLLHRSAIRLLVARLESSPRDVVAVAGDVMVRNSRSTIWSRLQMWDYLLGIAAVKRVQGFFQGTLVAQGAFSLYRTDAVRAAGGWPDAIGEDIVLTWQLLRAGRVFYEPMALAFTSAPDGLHALTKQRSRWARGMLEGIRAVPPWRQPRGIARALTSIDLAIPFLDVAYVFAWLPGLVLAGFGRYWIVGPMTVTVLPVTLFVYWLLYRFQRRQVLEPLGLVARRDHGGFLLFLLGYQALMSTMSVLGYAQQLLHRRRNWK
jgi:biofilm PGA synthesis N-glycosyltransferase PgaC